MPHLIWPECDDVIADITEAQLNFLRQHLESESHDDRDFFLDEATLTYLEESGCDPKLLSILRGALIARTQGSYRDSIIDQSVTIAWRDEQF